MKPSFWLISILFFSVQFSFAHNDSSVTTKKQSIAFNMLTCMVSSQNSMRGQELCRREAAERLEQVGNELVESLAGSETDILQSSSIRKDAKTFKDAIHQCGYFVSLYKSAQEQSAWIAKCRLNRAKEFVEYFEDLPDKYPNHAVLTEQIKYEIGLADWKDGLAKTVKVNNRLSDSGQAKIEMPAQVASTSVFNSDTNVGISSREKARCIDFYYTKTGERRRCPTPVVYRPTPSYSGYGTVHVRGYYRKDGTYVRPHTRSRRR